MQGLAPAQGADALGNIGKHSAEMRVHDDQVRDRVEHPSSISLSATSAV
jgi:hypothetical protein